MDEEAKFFTLGAGTILAAAGGLILLGDGFVRWITFATDTLGWNVQWAVGGSIAFAGLALIAASKMFPKGRDQ